MKQSELRQIIKEEIQNILNEEKYLVKPSKKGFSVIKNSTGAEVTSFDTEEKAKQHAEKLNKMRFIPKEKFNEGTPEQEKIKKVVDQYVNLRKAIDDSNYPDTPHTYSAMKKVENILQQMSRKENFRISLLKILPTQYQDFLK